jgi:hypothetical protein
MILRCPKCNRELPLADVNVAADAALCRSCGQAFKAGELIRAADTPPVDPDRPPSGAWYDETFDGFRLGATTRSCIALFLIPFMCVWSGGSLGGIYGSQIATGRFNPLLCLFGIPFLLGTVLFGSLALMTACGRQSLSVEGDEGVVFTGVGPIGRRKRFAWSEVTGIDEELRLGQKGQPSRAILLTGANPVRFGSMLSDARRQFFVGILRRKLQQRKPYVGGPDPLLQP